MAREPTHETHIDGLNPDDPGIAMLANAVAGQPAREILLVFSGDLPGVGAEASRLALDIRERSRALAHILPISLHAAPSDLPPFGHAIVWPRPHLGKDFTFACLARGALALRPGGTLWCAARKAKGAKSVNDEIAALMGDVEVVDRSRGYRLLRAYRGEAFDEPRARAHLDVRYTIEDPLLPGISLRSAPGVFSRRELDAGTRQLIEHAASHATQPRAVLDLCCGVGPLALWAATRWPDARVLAIDSNLLAVSLTEDNARRHELAGRLEVLASDGMPSDPPPRVASLRGEIELALVNPPTHADPGTLDRLAHDLREWLAPGAPAMLVVSRAQRMHEQLVASGARVHVHEKARYTVLEARWGGSR